MLWVLLTAFLHLPPRPSAYIASFLTGAPARALLRICHRESRCTAVGLHRRDASAGPIHYRLAVRGGALDPECHGGDPRRYSTRSSWGMVAAYVLRRLPGPLSCWAPPEVLDVPLVGAYVAGRHLLEGTHPATRRWSGAPT